MNQLIGTDIEIVQLGYWHRPWQRWGLGALRIYLVLFTLYHILKDKDYAQAYMEYLQFPDQWMGIITILEIVLMLLALFLPVINANFLVVKGLVHVTKDAFFVKKVNEPEAAVLYKEMADLRMKKVFRGMYELKINGHPIHLYLDKEMKEAFMELMRERSLTVVETKRLRGVFGVFN